MKLSFIKTALNALYDLCMAYVHRTYDRLQTVKINKAEPMTHLTSADIYRLMGAALGVLVLLSGTPSFAQSIKAGDLYKCASVSGLPAVQARVVKIETLKDLGIEGEAGKQKITHLQLKGIGQDDLPEVGHSPFAIEALLKCDGKRIRRNTKPIGDFNGGYQTWLKAFNDEGAGYFTLNPSEAYWMMLGVLDENGVRVQ